MHKTSTFAGSRKGHGTQPYIQFTGQAYSRTQTRDQSLLVENTCHRSTSINTLQKLQCIMTTDTDMTRYKTRRHVNSRKIRTRHVGCWVPQLINTFLGIFFIFVGIFIFFVYLQVFKINNYQNL